MTDASEVKRKKIIAVVKAVMFLGIIIALPLYIYFFHHEIIDTFSSVKSIEEFVVDHRSTGIFILILAQVVQIMICIIPGQPIQFAAGFVFHPALALLISLAGGFLGATITFYLAKLLGNDAMHMFFGKKKVTQYIDKLNTRNGYFLLFALCVIPGFPKDAMCYIAGLSKIRYIPFIVLVTVARIPGLLGSILVGHFSYSQQYMLVAVVAIIVLVLTVICIKHKDRILEWGDKIYTKLNRRYEA